MKELHTGDIRWYFDEDSEKAYEVMIDCASTGDGFWSPCYWCTILETGRQSIFRSRFLYNSKEKATKGFTKELEEDIKSRENDLKKYVEEETALIKKQKTLLEKLKKQKENPK